MENEIVNDKVCIITGGSRGLGKGMTLALTAAGAKVIAPRHIPTDIPLIENDVSRKVLIEMNAPLRHSTYTFYQASFIAPVSHNWATGHL